jgi:hypothetical protein
MIMYRNKKFCHTKKSPLKIFYCFFYCLFSASQKRVNKKTLSFSVAYFRSPPLFFCFFGGYIIKKIVWFGC